MRAMDFTQLDLTCMRAELNNVKADLVILQVLIEDLTAAVNELRATVDHPSEEKEEPRQTGAGCG